MKNNTVMGNIFEIQNRSSITFFGNNIYPNFCESKATKRCFLFDIRTVSVKTETKDRDI